MAVRSNNFTKMWRKHGRKILKIVGYIGFLAAPVAAVPATVKAVRACDKRKEELGVEKLPVKEIVKTTWKDYILTLSLIGVSTASMAGSDSIASKNAAVLTTACTVAEKTLSDYKDETIKKIGEKKGREIEQEVMKKQAEEKIEALNNSGELFIQGTKTGQTSLYYEPITGTLFYATKNQIESAFLDVSAKMLREIYADLGDLFDCLGLRRVRACDDYGWNSSMVQSIRPRCFYDGIELNGEKIPFVVMGYEDDPKTTFMSSDR